MNAILVITTDRFEQCRSALVQRPYISNLTPCHQESHRKRFLQRELFAKTGKRAYIALQSTKPQAASDSPSEWTLAKATTEIRAVESLAQAPQRE